MASVRNGVCSVGSEGIYADSLQTECRFLSTRNTYIWAPNTDTMLALVWAGMGLAKASIIEPLKMQGVDSFGDFAMVVRLKMMTKPGEQFTMKRKALLMIRKAFEENGIKIAVPTVQVSGGGDEAAAAASETIRMRKAAEAAAAKPA